MIVGRFGHRPTDCQQAALETFGRFLADRSPESVMVLRGSAGTGKTSLAAAMVSVLHALGQKLTLMAPTGRAAKVFARSSRLPAYTIHRRIYRERAYQGLDGLFNLNDNRYHNMLFVVDEASMIGEGSQGEEAFGSGSLLNDLIKYVYSGDNCRLLLIGDKAQLPPVGEAEAPALSAGRLRGYGLRVYETDLDEVLRQGERSGILFNATRLRDMIVRDETTMLPPVTFRGFADIVNLRGDELVETLQSSFDEVGMDETIVVTRSNKRAGIYNQGIRNTVLDREDELSSGDLLMIVRNNYYWTELELKAMQAGVARGVPAQPVPVTFLANGDRAVVERVRNVRELYGFRFADVWLRFPDYDDYEMQVTVNMDSLLTDAPALTREQSERLFNEVMQDYADLTTKHERLRAVKGDAYFNALQVKFAYAVTCHKAQGGQWSHVYVDQGYMTDDMVNADYYHWLYTAFTRATEKLYLVNWKEEGI